MSILKSYQYGWSQLLLKYKLWIILFLINIAFALFIFLPLKGFFTDQIGQSLMMDQTRHLFDYTFVNDFLNNYGLGLEGILGVSKWIAFLYFLLNVFLVGAMLEFIRVDNVKYNHNSFFIGGIKNYWRLFSLSLLFLLLQILLIFVFFKLFSGLLGSLSPFEIDLDTDVISLVQILIPIYLLSSFILFLIADYSKISLIYHPDRNILRHIKYAISFISKHWLRAFLLYFLLLVSFLIIAAVHHYLQSILQNETGVWLLISLLMGQLFIIFRIGLKFVNLSALNQLHKFQNNEATIV